jgi:hypothetical protein
MKIMMMMMMMKMMMQIPICGWIGNAGLAYSDSASDFNQSRTSAPSGRGFASAGLGSNQTGREARRTRQKRRARWDKTLLRPLAFPEDGTPVE